jgi:hypothetical protein
MYPQDYEEWFRKQVEEALEDTRPARSHYLVMQEVQALIDRKKAASASNG